MEEIKVRAWDKSKKKMFSSDLIARIHFNKGLPYAVMLWSGHAFFYNNMVIQQYTGKKDKNGKEVYKGDVVNIRPYPFNDKKWHCGEVFWMNEYGGWGVKCFYSKIKGRKLSFYSFQFQSIQEMEIIGNKNENPELLDNERRR